MLTLATMPASLVKYYERVDKEDVTLYEKLLTKRVGQFSELNLSELINTSVDHFKKTFIEGDYNPAFKNFVQDYIWVLNETKIAYEKRDLKTLSELSLMTEAMMADLYKAIEHRFDK